ncbi:MULTISPECIES: FAD-dependent monooxygenase [Streptomyces]|uniref:FAD-dependent monooxygenase n=1 Tax=Streptomyces TaxID=1883 RepID=UPI002810B78C|nr:FAD-dependent monooxygenase [Streptomyces sp.]
MAGTAADTDVIVVGAGPSGLMLAGELRLGGARVVVIEKLAEPTGQSRGLGFTARAMETFDARGLLPRFGQGETLETSPMGHFGGTQFDFTVLQDAHFGARGIPQGQTEAVLEAWASETGADIRRGWEFVSLADGFLDGPDVEITVRDAEGVERRLRASYLVGCDGGASRVRKAAGFDFPGTDATQGMYLADITGVELRPRFLGERLRNGMVMSAPLTEDVWRIIVCPDGRPAHDRERTVTYEEVAAAWQDITGEDISAGRADWVSSFTNATRQASEYRRGRVFLAGDAAHIHLPAGGQGLSTGVQDAANLGWKLAAAVRGDAPAGLLDTYHAERHPAGRRLLMNTRAQGIVYLGGAESEPLRELFGELVRYDDVKRHLAGIVSHLDIRYDLGEDTGEEHALLGRRMPPRLLVGPDGETPVARLLHAGRGVVLDLGDDPAVRRAVAGHRDRVDTVTAVAKPTDAADSLTGIKALLIRPDGYVAWASATSATGLAPALERWFGPAR